MWRRVLVAGAVSLASCAADEGGGTQVNSSSDATDDVGQNTDVLADIDASSDVHIDELRYEPCTVVSIPTRFDAGWERLNHRISQLGFLRAAGSGECAVDAWDLTFVGGDFTTGGVATDEAEIGFDWVDVAFAAGEAAAIRVPIETLVRPGGTVSGVLALTDGETGLGEFEHVVAVIGGFRLDTDSPQPDTYPEEYDPALGYTSRGLGFDVEASREPGSAVIELRWSIRFEHGATFDGFIRPDMNAAIAHAQSAALLEVIVVASSDPATTREVQWLQETEEPYRATTEREPAVDVSLRTLELSGSGDATGVAALSAFQFRLYPDAACSADRDCDQGDTCGADGECVLPFGPPGDYVRQLATGVEVVGVDETTGAATVVVDGYASTASEAFAFRPLEHNFSARVAWFQAASATHWRFAGTQPTGTRTITRDDVQTE